MNTGDPHVHSWTGPGWLLSVLLVTAIQVGLIFWLGDHRPLPVRPLKAKTVVQFPPEYQHDALSDQDRPDDPTLFALVSPRGFSRAAWLTLAPFNYEVTNHVEESHGPGSLTNASVADVGELLRSNIVVGADFAGLPPPRPTEVVLPVPVVLAATQVRTEGEIAGRGLLTRQGLPEQPEPILTNTIVRVAIDAQGRTVSAAILSSCLVASADEQALQFARQARFAPAGELSLSNESAPAQLAFGTLVFQWFQVRWVREGGALQASAEHGR